MNYNCSVDLNLVIHWMNSIRSVAEPERFRALEAFWDTQLSSKCWLVNNLKAHLPPNTKDAFIFGGWTGVLASLLLSNPNFNLDFVYNIDIDPWCKPISNITCNNNPKFIPIVDNMATYSYPHSDSTLVINTSTEHVTQSVYDQWYDNVPVGSIVVAQGNNFYKCVEHVRCSNSLDEFKKINNIPETTYYEGILPNSLYERYMCIWKKQ